VLPSAAPLAAVDVAAEIADVDAFAASFADIPEPDLDDGPSMMPVQGGLLARLFKRGKPANESEFHNFEELLEDSVEDQELRHKLSMGMAGRVP
jgi:hypothetical protein